MKTTQTFAIAAIFITTFFNSLAYASNSTGSLGTDVQSAVASGHVHATLKNGVATLYGSVETRVDRNAAIRAATRFPGVEKVRSNIYVKN